MARVCRPTPRRRRPHQLRPSSPAFVLPDQEWRSARLRSRGDRSDCAGRSISSPGHSEEISRGVRRPEQHAPAHRSRAVGNCPPGRRTGSQSRAGAGRNRSVSARRRLSCTSARQWRCGAGALGGAPARRAARAGTGAADPLRGLRHHVQGTTVSC
jgi:hypothetical protein